MVPGQQSAGAVAEVGGPALGIPPKALGLLDVAVEIPMIGTGPA